MKTKKLHTNERDFQNVVEGVLRHFREYYVRSRIRDSQERAETVGEVTLDENQKEVWAKLNEWRREEARRRSVPVYLVLTNRTLFALAANPPRSLEALSTVPGIGPRKIEELGATLLALIKELSDRYRSDTSSESCETLSAPLPLSLRIP